MNYVKILEDAYNTLVSFIDDECFIEVYNIINSIEPVNPDLYRESCSKMGLNVGASGFVVIDNSNVLQIAAYSLIFLEASNDTNPYPVFFNQARENIELIYLVNNLFIFNGLDTALPVEQELLISFLETLRNVNNVYIIGAPEVLKIIDLYTTIDDVSIAIADYVQISKSDINLLSNYGVSSTSFVGKNSQVWGVLKDMYMQQRLDYCSFNILKSNIGD